MYVSSSSMPMNILRQVVVKLPKTFLQHHAPCSMWRTLTSRRNTRVLCMCMNDRRHYSRTKNPKIRPLKKEEPRTLSSIVQPLSVKSESDPDGVNIGEELVGKLDKGKTKTVLNAFHRQPHISRMAAEQAIDDKLFHRVMVGFRNFCIDSQQLPNELHVILHDLCNEAGHVDELFPFFIDHAKKMFPHLESMEELLKISDLRSPSKWYPNARSLKRKVVFHSGPTNSGKTYHALQKFMSAESGVYCGPLRLLASEVYLKSNADGTLCDLVTGEDRKRARADGEPSSHVSCTVEMANLSVPYDIAVIDEIQMVRDIQRGWAWTQAFLGVWAKEVHVCGEPAAISLIEDLTFRCGDDFELHKYERLTPLTILDKGVDNLGDIRDGDCIVCFSKAQIYTVTQELEARGREVAVIYGSLPPGTKLAQAAKFNDPTNSCKILVATDAIGMGLNLNIKRIVMYTLIKSTINEEGLSAKLPISVSQAKQIAGRAGRFKTEYADGEATTFRSADLVQFTNLMQQEIPLITKAGINPTAEQIEEFSLHLPNASLSELVDIFISVSQVDNDNFFMCGMNEFKALADSIDHIPLRLKIKYTFCCAPISKDQIPVTTMFVKFASKHARAEPLTTEWLGRQLDWPYKEPKLLSDLVEMESIFDTLDLYLWLGYRYPDTFPDMDDVREMQNELDELIQKGIVNLTTLLKKSPHASQTDGVMTPSARADKLTLEKRGNLSDRLGKKKRIPQPAKGKERVQLNAMLERESLHKKSSRLPNRTYVKEFASRKKQEVTHESSLLTDKLVAEGVLTKAMIKQIQLELVKKIKEKDDD